VAIGTGSFLFHTVATPWARVLDLAPVLLFQVSYLWLYSRSAAAMPVGPAAVLVLGFLAAVLTGLQFPEVLNGSLVYAPAVIAITGVGVHHYRTHDRARLVLLAAAGVLAIGVFFRVIDRAACAALPLGTHFLWHLLTARALYALGRALLAGVPSRPLLA